MNEAATATVGGTPAPVDPGNGFQGTAPRGSGTSNVVITAREPSGNLRTNTCQDTISGSTTTFSYDANGSLTGVGTKTYEWDGANRLVQVLDGANEIVAVRLRCGPQEPEDRGGCHPRVRIRQRGHPRGAAQ